jgi:hypothetical protein
MAVPRSRGKFSPAKDQRLADGICRRRRLVPSWESAACCVASELKRRKARIRNDSSAEK